MATIVVCSLAIAFAYIGRPTISGNTNTNVTINGGAATFSYTGSSSLSIAINTTNDELSSANASNSYTSYIESSSATTTVSLTTNASLAPKGMTCPYTIIYTPSTAYTQSSGATSAGLRELVITATDGSSNYEKSIAGSNVVTLVSNASIATSSSTTSKSTTWTFKMRFYNLNVDQESVIGRVPSGTISITNGECEANS